MPDTIPLSERAARVPSEGEAAQAGLASAATSPVGSEKGGAPVHADSDRLRELESQVADLNNHFAEVVRLVRSSTDEMIDGGIPPHYQVVLALGDCQRRFLRLRSEIIAAIPTLGSTSLAQRPLSGLRDLSSVLHELLKPSMSGATDSGLILASPATAGPSIEPPADPQDSRSTDAALGPDQFGHAEVATSAIETSRESSHDVAVGQESAPEEVIEIFAVDPEDTGFDEFAHEVISPLENPYADPVTSDSGDIQEGPSLADVSFPPSAVAPEETTSSNLEDVRRSALTVLGKALRLSLRDGGELSSLTEFHESAHRLIASIESTDPGDWQAEAQRLVSGEHPVAWLVQAIEGKEDLSDSEWADLHTVVGETFGRQMAVALARHRLVLKAD